MKFLIDAMLGRLARFLRIFGYDTVFANDLEELYDISPIPDLKLKQFARESHRIVITKDLQFYHSLCDNRVYLKGVGVYNYLSQLKSELGLDYNFDPKKTRCSVCNSEMKMVTDKELIRNSVKTETYHNFNEFYRCINPSCEKIFWKGSHIEDIISRLEKHRAEKDII